MKTQHLESLVVEVDVCHKPLLKASELLLLLLLLLCDDDKLILGVMVLKALRRSRKSKHALVPRRRLGDKAAGFPRRVGTA
jgi:hypothetical protein